MINLKVRIKNPVFWAQIFLAIAAPIGAYFGLTGADMTSWAMVWDTILSAVANPYVVVMVLISVWNAVNDPTTAGVSDSQQAMSYSCPKK